jgi:hypothetical protein
MMESGAQPHPEYHASKAEITKHKRSDLIRIGFEIAHEVQEVIILGVIGRHEAILLALTTLAQQIHAELTSIHTHGTMMQKRTFLYNIIL